MANVFITGATGFIGSHLCEYLAENGHYVALGVRQNADPAKIKSLATVYSVHEYTESPNDLGSFLKAQKIDAVFHLASCFIAEHQSEDINALVNSNILFGTILLEAMKLAGVKKLVNSGTSWQHYQNESYNPVCLYAATKDAFERIITYYHEAEDLSCITLKLFDSYSEKDTRPKLINLLGRFSREGKTLDMSEGEQQINLLHAEDVCRGFEVAYTNFREKGKINKSYALAAKETITLKELIGIFNSISKDKISVNWGGKPYRKREVMTLWNSFELLPDWKQKISLNQGLSRVFNKKRDLT